ncbi:MAG TPA: M57 family metalloprotease, partial [Nitrososphaera sp.]|nr:M57 family metalloprotease [Nitrososphaera sp.]
MILKHKKTLRHASLAALVVVICSLILCVIQFAGAQQCSTDQQLSGALRTRAPDANGIIHVTYSFADANLATPERNAILNAISQWNGGSASTKVQFDLAPAGTSSDLEFKPSNDPSQTGGCAGYLSTTGRVYYSPEWQQRAQNSAAAGATVIAHELGHFLGLADAGTNPLR